MKNILEQAINKVTIVGKLLDVTFGNGTTKTGVPYERATVNIRVTQTYGGREETSEIPVGMFSTQYTSKGAVNPAWKSLQALKEMKTAQNVGFDAADTVAFRGSGAASLRENNFVSKSGQLITSWQLSGSFINTTTASDAATFNIDIFIMDMHPETTRDGDPTGRLVIKGGIVQYNGELDVVEFIVEGPDQVEYIERNWEENTTVNVQGRVRITTVEDKHSGHSGSWREEVPEDTTRIVRELIITTGDDVPKDEEFSYEPVDIKKAFAARKAKIEQLQIDAKNTKAAAPASAASTSSKYSWE